MENEQIEVSLITRLLVSVGKLLVQCHFGALIILSLSLSLTIGYLEFSWSTLGERGYLVIWIKKAKEKALERHEPLIGILFMKIMEIRRKGR